jgi:hypothetical protein
VKVCNSLQLFRLAKDLPNLSGERISFDVNAINAINAINAQAQNIQSADPVSR